MAALDAESAQPLILGVAQDVRADKAIDGAISRSTWFNRNGFTFKAVPTPKAVMGALTRRGDSTKESAATATGTGNLATFWGIDGNPKSGAAVEHGDGEEA